MPKPVKKPARKPRTPAKPKRPTDPNRAARAILVEHLARLPDEPIPLSPLDFNAQYKAHMAKLGKQGRKASGAKRAAFDKRTSSTRGLARKPKA